MLWRHGDVLIAQIPSIPKTTKRSSSPILVRGEVTGHSHRIEDPAAAEVWITNKGELYLKILAITRLVHEEHLPITLQPGNYRVWKQREYTPQAPQKVRPVYD